MSEKQVLAADILSTTTALLTSGAILSISLFEIPNLLSTPSTTSLPQLRALFSRGSHVVPPAASASLAIYAWLAYHADRAGHLDRRNGYVAAAVGVASIMPFTTLVMLPAANGRLIEMEENRKRRGGEVSGGEEREEKELLRRFWWMNTVRGLLMGVGGVVGIWTAMTR
ncbi:hypothetical protein LTR66_010507 [Elasticomyces elasticus]|nr:hypothetical protein LTR28_005301 [Elasticomyces elasticus]KAK4979447.1 hypothetical protein LTR66_010507 [Elasticomyces elasticus]